MKLSFKNNTGKSKAGVLLGAALTALAVSGCAHQPATEITAQMARAQSSIAQAEQSGAQQSALPELQAAKDKFAEAQRALDKKDEQQALRLAQQAQIDAQYAAAKAQTHRQQQAAEEVRSSTDVLRRETSGSDGS